MATRSASRPATRCLRVSDGQWVVVNAESYEDLDAVVRAARESGRVLLYRTGPSFVRALAGLEERPPLSEVPRREGHGLVVVGSHVGLTSRQVAAAQERCGLIEIELDVNALDVDGVSERVVGALARAGTCCSTRAASSRAAGSTSRARCRRP